MASSAPSSHRLAGSSIDLSQTLVVVVPGIGGTRLGTAPDQMVWDIGISQIGNVLLRPRELDPERQLHSFGLVKSWKAFGVWTKVDGYGELLGGLGRIPSAVVDEGRHGLRERNLDANVVAVGYDFRHGVALAAEELDATLRSYLVHRWPKGGRNKIVFIAHSMGGLVVSEWLRRSNNARWCRSVHTLATPFGGAPKALDFLANGVKVGPARIRGSLLDVLRSWQSMYDLIPTGNSVMANEQKMIDAHDLPLGWDVRKAQAARTLHDDLASTEAPWTNRLRPWSGHGQATPALSSWSGGTKVTVHKQRPSAEGTGWERRAGDGTVPASRSFPRGFDTRADSFVPSLYSKHGPIALWDGPSRAVRDAGEFPVIEGDQVVEQVLGVELEELATHGSPVPISISAPTVGGDTGRVAIRLTDDSHPSPFGFPPVGLDFDTDKKVFSGVVPCPGPGVYTVTATWQDPHRELQTKSALQIIDPHEMELDHE